MDIHLVLKSFLRVLSLLFRGRRKKNTELKPRKTHFQFNREIEMTIKLFLIANRKIYAECIKKSVYIRKIRNYNAYEILLPRNFLARKYLADESVELQFDRYSTVTQHLS